MKRETAFVNLLIFREREKRKRMWLDLLLPAWKQCSAASPSIKDIDRNIFEMTSPRAKTLNHV